MLFTKKELLRLIVPLFIEQALTIAVGMADTVMVAQAGEAAVSGVSLVDSVNILVLYFLGALTTGGAIVTSHAIGAKDRDTAQRSMKQLIWLSFLVGAAFSLFMVIFRKGLLRLIFGAVSAEIMDNALVYFLFTAMSYPFLALRNAVGANYRVYGNSKVSLYASMITNVVNIGGNALLIFVFRMGAAGAAIATLFSRIVGAAIMVALSCNKNSVAYVERLFHYMPDRKLIGRILSIGMPNGFENSMFQLGKVVTQSLVSTLGSVAIAANAAASSLCSLMYVPGAAFGQAMTTVVGRCIGAQEKKQASVYARRLLGTDYLVRIVMAISACVFSAQLVGLFSLSDAATATAVRLFIFHNIFVATVHPIAFCLTNAFRAAGDVRYPMLLSIVSMWALRVGASFFFAHVMDMGIMGVWTGMVCDWSFRACVYGVRYLRGTWLTKYRVETGANT